MELRLSVSGAPDTDLLLDADPGSPVGEVGAEISRVTGRPGGEIFVDGTPVDPGVPLIGSPLRDGLVLGIGEPPAEPARCGQGVAEVRVVGGPGAGEVVRLGPGTATLGAGAGDWIRVADPELPKGALEIDIADDGAVTVSAAAGLTATLEGEPLIGAVAWPRGHVVSLGRTLLTVATPDFPDAPLTPSPDGGGLDYNRPPRLAPPDHPTKFTLPTRPKAGQNRPLPWIMALVPLVAAIVLALVLGRLMFLAFAIFSPVMIFANSINDKRQGKKSFALSAEEYRNRRADIEADVRAALAAEQAERRAGCPDPALAGLIAVGPRHRLWERRRTDVDFGHLRLGAGTLPAAVEVTNPEAEEHRRRDPIMLTDVPVTVPLCTDSVLGVAGSSAEEVRAIGRWLVAQAAVLHSPRDLQVCVLTSPAALPSWQWLRWLPHAHPAGEARSLTLLGAAGETVGRRISELQTLLSDRQTSARQANPSGSAVRYAGPELLVVLDGSRRLRALPGVAQILREGPEVGIRLICLDTDERLLPEECKAVATLDPAGWLRVRRAGQATVEKVRPDEVSPDWCEATARAIAPLRDVTDEDDSALPDHARLLELLELEPPTAAAIVTGWSGGGRSTKAVIGAGMDGPFTIDLVRDGPHGLMAGTTGSGKSELLQTLVASLAVANRPDAMTFVLVDYKGGSAFKECVALPHTVGMVTDLDTSLVSRALESLAAELRRREHILAAAGTKDLEDYVDACRRDPALAPMPRLLIVIDEFASLARELPDFVTGLVNIAQRGRSLGIHLVLATQRPSGVVSPEIRANTNLRIALRVTDKAESSDVIDAPDAARIAKSTPGRAFVRLGHSSLLPFQSGRVGGRRPSATAEEAPPPWAAVFDTDQLGNPHPARPKRGSGAAEDTATDLGELVTAIRAAATELGVPAQHSPWLPPLPDQVTVEDIATDGADATGPLRPVDEALRPGGYALVDVPAQQARRVESVNLDTFGHLLIAGAARSGRSQALRTIAGAVAAANTAANVHLYGIDCGNGALLPLSKLPHCGAIVRSTDADRAERLIDKLTAEMRRRMALLGEAGYTDVSEQRTGSAPEERLSHIVVLLDRWEGFVATLGERNSGALTDTVLQLLREGASAGIHLVIAGDHTLLSGRISNLTEHKLALRLSDTSHYSQIGVNPRKVPAELAPGRGYWAGSGLQAQIALLAEDPSGHAQAAAIERIAGMAEVRDKDLQPTQRPFGVDDLPARIDLDRAWDLRPPGTGALWSLVAVGGDTLTALGPDLATGTPAFVIGGPPESGRSTALCTMAAASLRAGAEVVLVAPRTSPVQQMAGMPGVLALFTGSTLDGTALQESLAAARGPVVVFMDDAELLKDTGPADVLNAILRRQSDEQRALVIAGDPDAMCSGFGGWQPAVKRARRGLLLSPQSMTDADLLSIKLPRTSIGQPVIPGRGILCLGGGETVAVQVPVP